MKMTAMGQMAGWPTPRMGTSSNTCSTAPPTATRLSMEPIDRSSWRMTISNTMPVDMMAMEEVWTSNVQRLRGVRKEPPRSPPKLPRMMPDAMSKAAQISSKATTMPSRRSSISVARKKRFTGAFVLQGRTLARRGCIGHCLPLKCPAYVFRFLTLEKNRTTFASGAVPYVSGARS